MSKYDRRKTCDLPEVKSIRRVSVEAFRSARDARSALGIPGDPILTDRPQSRSGRVATAGYTGYRPRHLVDEGDPFEDEPQPLCISPIRKGDKIRGYTGYIPGSKSNIGARSDLGATDIVLDRAMSKSTSYQLLKLMSSNQFTESDMPKCKYKVVPGDLNREDAPKYLRPGHADFISYRYGSLENMRKRYADATASVESTGQTQRSLLTLVQSKLSERVTSYASQIIRIKNIFKYFDFDDSNTLDELEFQQFLERSNCYLEEPQRIALFAYFDTQETGGISWETFQRNCTVPNPKGGTAVLPKAITRYYSLDS